MPTKTPLTMKDGAQPLTIGELFPSDDLLAQWVFALSSVVEDLSVADTQLHRALDGEPNGQSMFHYRVLVSRVYEAKRIVLAAEERSDIRAFVEGVREAQAEIQFLRTMFLPRLGSSRVDDLYALMRHRTIHHSFPGSDELTAALHAAADLEAFYVLDHEAGTSHFIWPELVTIRSLVGDMEDPAKVAEFREMVELAGRITVAFTTLLRWVLEAHCKRLKVQHQQLIRHRGQPPGSAAPPPSRAARRHAAKNKKRRS